MKLSLIHIFYHDSVGKYQGQISRYCIFQGWNQVVSAQPLFCRTPAPAEVSEGLHHDFTIAEHVAQLGDLFAVLDGCLEGLRKFLDTSRAKLGLLVLYS